MMAVTAPAMSALGQPEMEPMLEPDMEAPMMSPDDGSCMLTGGEIVPDGYSGFDTGMTMTMNICTRWMTE